MGAVVRWCPPAPEVKAAAPPEPAEGRFSATLTIEEIAQSSEKLADDCIAAAQGLPEERAATLLLIASLAYATAWEFRAGRFPD